MKVIDGRNRTPQLTRHKKMFSFVVNASNGQIHTDTNRFQKCLFKKSE